jgi:hypothetical protein
MTPTAADTDPRPVAPRDAVIDSTVAPGGWDFALMVATLVLLALLGAQSIIGTGYAWWAERSIPGWEQTGYAGYVAVMNVIAAPLVIGLVVVLGLCVPKRILSRYWLIGVSAALVAAGVVGWLATGSLTTGLAVYLVLASILQLVVVLMTFLGAGAKVTYLTEGRLVKTGSGLLHMGFLLFALVVAALQQSPWMLLVFWLSALCIVVGTLLSFYAAKLVRRRPSRPAPGAED